MSFWNYIKIKLFRNESGSLYFVPLLKFFFLLVFAGNYGLFRDEFYYIECSKHLAWGYVDQPPLSLFILYVSRAVFGESILGIRILSYAVSCGTVFISGLIAREMGGKKFSQILTQVCVVFSPVVLGGGSIYSMNSFDVFFAASAFYTLVKLIRTENLKLWLVFGIISGIGLQNKLSFLFIGFGTAVSLLLTKNRKYFLTKEIYIGALIALIIFLPHLIWQIQNGFPTIEFMRNAAERKNVRLGFAEFFVGSMMEMNPLYIILLLAAGWFLFFDREGKRFSFLALTYLVVLTVFVLNHGKPYYMGILFPPMIAAGVVGADSFIERHLKRIGRIILLAILVPSFVIITPFAIPVLSIEGYIKYSETLGIKPPSQERLRSSILPQFFADRFGWKEMAEKAGKAYNKLTDAEKKNAVIFAQNYGEAGALNYYSKEFGLPERIYSPHNSYWFWGPPAMDEKTVAIIVGSNLKDNGEWFEEVGLSESHRNRYGMPYENVDIFICRKIKIPIKTAWRELKDFI